jgi:uncharacterized SAM-dependent methyltransferase
MPTEDRVKLTITIPSGTVADLRCLLGDAAERPDEIARYFERTVARDVLRQTIRRIQERNRHLDPEEVQREADKAVREVRQEKLARLLAAENQA